MERVYEGGRDRYMLSGVVLALKQADLDGAYRERVKRVVQEAPADATASHVARKVPRARRFLKAAEAVSRKHWRWIVTTTLATAAIAIADEANDVSREANDIARASLKLDAEKAAQEERRRAAERPDRAAERSTSQLSLADMERIAKYVDEQLKQRLSQEEREDVNTRRDER